MFWLRKWIILRLVSLVDSLHLGMEEALTEEVARYERGWSFPWACGRGMSPSTHSGLCPLEPEAFGLSHQWGAGTRGLGNSSGACREETQEAPQLQVPKRFGCAVHALQGAFAHGWHQGSLPHTCLICVQAEPGAHLTLSVPGRRRGLH